MTSLNRKVLIFTFCTIGCLIQLYDVINEFLKFPVRTDIIYDYPENMVIPEIDIFLYNLDLINMTELYLKYPKDMTHLCENFLRRSNLTIDSVEIFNADCSKILKSYHENSYSIGKMLTVGDVEKLNIESLIFKFKINEFIRNDLCSVNKYFNGIATFIRVSCRENSKLIKRRLVKNIVADDRFCIFHNIYSRFGVRLAHPNRTIDYANLNYIEAEREKDDNVFTLLRYQEIIVENREWPYQTNCRHYDKSESFSQCLREKIMRLHPGTIQLEDVLSVGQVPSHFKFDDLATSANEALTQIRSTCSEQLKQLQCNERTYRTSGKAYKEKGSGIGLICLENQVDFNIILKTYPKLTFAELLIYVSSILGIWFGISIYGNLIGICIHPIAPERPIKKSLNVQLIDVHLLNRLSYTTFPHNRASR